MFERADAFVVGPGGFGTFEEAFEVLTGVQLGYHAKPIVFLDLDGFWGLLQQFLDHAVAHRRAAARHARPVPHRRERRARRRRQAIVRSLRDILFAWPLAPLARCLRSWRPCCSRRHWLAGSCRALVPGWWDGHPIVDGKVLRAQGRSTSACSRRTVATSARRSSARSARPRSHARAVGYGELGGTRPRRRDGAVARDVDVEDRRSPKVSRQARCCSRSSLIGGGAAAIFFHASPDLEVKIQARDSRRNWPVSPSPAARRSRFLASLIAMRLEPEPLRLKTSEPRMPHPHQHAARVRRARAVAR